MITRNKKLLHPGNSLENSFKRYVLKVFTSIFLIVFSVSLFAQNKFKPGQTFHDCPTCPEMVVIPSGSYMIGSPDGEPGRYPQEGPQKKVSIKQFAVGKFDITKAEWAAFVAATNRVTTGGCFWSLLPQNDSTASWNHLGFSQDSSHPVVCITWDDSQDYIRWLSKKAGFTYRLLTEAEWEYAARAGTTTAYPWGNSASHEYANYGADSGFQGLASGQDRWIGTSPAGSFAPNAFGLYDMHGNVFQWVEDYFFNSYSDLPANGAAYKIIVKLKMESDFGAGENTHSWMNGTSSSEYRMTRGGDFTGSPRMIRSAFRNFGPSPPAPPYFRISGLGFRVARTL